MSSIILQMGCCTSKQFPATGGKANQNTPLPSQATQGVSPEEMSKPSSDPSSQMRKLTGLNIADVAGGGSGRQTYPQHLTLSSEKRPGSIREVQLPPDGASSGNNRDESKTLQIDKPEVTKWKKRPSPVYFDISPNGGQASLSANQQIYRVVINGASQVSNKSVSTMTDWQNFLNSNSFTQLQDDELLSKFLNMKKRNWVQEQVKLLHEYNSQTPQSFDGLKTSSRIIQLREHFNWLVWALAQFYFFFNGTSHFYFQFQNSSIVPSKPPGGGANSTLAQTNAEVSQSLNSSKTGKSVNTQATQYLPKVGSKAWSDGFEYKGVYIRVMPYEDAKYIRNEIKALQQIQIEILELRQLIKNQGVGKGQQMSSMLHQEVILPLIAGVSFGGFYLYATPIIDLQSSPQLDKLIEKDFAHVRDLAGHTIVSPKPLILSQSPQPLPENLQDVFSSIKASQFYLQDSDPLVTQSTFKLMPILKRLDSKNMIPLLDLEAQVTGGPKMGERPLSLQTSYLLMNLYDRLPDLTLTGQSEDSIMMRIPAATTEDITFHTLNKYLHNDTKAYIMESKELKQFLHSGIMPKTCSSFIGASSNAMNPKKPSIFLTQQKIFMIPPSIGESGDLDIQADEYQQNIFSIDEEPEDRRFAGYDQDPAQTLQDLFQRRSFVKQGWEFTLISKKCQPPQGATQQPPATYLFTSVFNENKRALNLYVSKEAQLKQCTTRSDALLLVGGGARKNVDFIHHKSEVLTPSKLHIVPIEEYDNELQQAYNDGAGTNQVGYASGLSRFSIFQNRQEAGGILQGTVIYDQTELSAQVTPTNAFFGSTQSKIYGSVVLTARQYKKGLKLQYAVTTHSGDIDQIVLNASLDQVVHVLEKSDKIFNIQSLRDLMHRKGLNLRFCWALLPKLRWNQARELVMIEILMKVMRKIVNEEIRHRSIVVTSTPYNDERGNSVEEYCQAGGTGQVDTYKETIVFFMNTILKRKVHKNKSAFEEILLSLFLSRTSILTLLPFISLKREENNYLESKDILEDIIEAPSRNPSLFVNSVSTYFKMEFNKDFLRQLRQDKLVFLAKTQPILKSDIMKLSCRNNLQNYFTVKEEAYFILARSINHKMAADQKKGGLQQPIVAPGQIMGGPARSLSEAKTLLEGAATQNLANPQAINPTKIKTKTDKDRMVLESTNFPNRKGSVGPQIRDREILLGESARGQDLNDVSVTQSNVESNEIQNQSSIWSQQNGRNPSTILNQNVKSKGELFDFRQRPGGGVDVEPSNTARQFQNLESLINESPKFTQQHEIHDFAKLSKRNNFKPSQTPEIVLPSILYKYKIQLHGQSLSHLEDPSKPSLGDQISILKPYYEMPGVDVIDEWNIVMESLLKDVKTVNGGEQVLIEALIYQAFLVYFFKSGESEELLKVLSGIRDALFKITICSPEILILTQILTGIYFEDNQEAQVQVEAEKSYLTAMICLFQLYGDPRGRGNHSIPYTLFLSWKLSLLSLAEDKKIHDSEFAEELFDGALRCLTNHRLVYKEHQIQTASNQSMLYKTGNANSLPTEVMAGGQQHERCKFEKLTERVEMNRLRFDIKRFRNRPPYNVTIASGMYKTNGPIMNRRALGSQQAAMNVYISVNHHYQNNKELKGAALDRMLISDQNQFGMSQDFLKSRSQLLITGVRSRKPEKDEDGNHNAYDLEPSEIELDIEEDNKNFLLEENFLESEYQVGVCPFQHWSIYRQQIMQILQAHNLHRNTPAQNQYQKQIYKDMQHKFLPKDLFFQWIMRFNPIMYQSGQLWSLPTIRDLIFNENQQMISSSSSSVVMSNHNLSHHSMRSHSNISIRNTSKERKNVHLGTYSQILGKEGGGIAKQEMHGILFTMGTDGYGQLGIDTITQPQKEVQSINIKVLYPRMVLSLRDEIIKEICCGHCHTLAYNIHGQLFAWGLNESGQLGLGPDAPPVIRKPVLNPNITNIAKLSAGNEHSLAINKAGELFIWGGGGLLGLGDPAPRSLPTKLDFFSGMRIQQAVCGGLHTCVLTKEGDLYTWGSTEGGQLGLSPSLLAQLTTQLDGCSSPVMTPQKVPRMEGQIVTQVACGEAHTIVVTKDGKVFGWGMSNYGQLGLGYSADSFEPGVGMERSKVYEPTEITGLRGEGKIVKIVCGATFSLFQTEKGDIFGCGMNDLGQLGLDTFMDDLISQQSGLDNVKKGKHHQNSSDVTLPTKVICFQGIGLHNIACGENHALAVSGDDKNMLWAWGMYRQGQLGLGEVAMKMNPRPVQTLCSSTINKIACGSMHSLALIGDHQQVQNISSQYYAGANSFDSLQHYWVSDFGNMASTLDKKATIINERGIDDDWGTDGSGGGAIHGVSQIYNIPQYWTNNNQNNDGRENVKTAELQQDFAGEGKVKNPQ